MADRYWQGRETRPMDYTRRQRRIEQELGRRRLEAMLVTHTANVRYLCGFTGSAGTLLLFANGRRPVFVTDGRYAEQASAEVQRARIVVSKNGTLAEVAKNAARFGVRTLGVEAEHTTLAARTALRRKLGGATRLREIQGLVEGARAVKDGDELRLIRSAVVLGGSLLEKALEVIRPGVRESMVAAELEYAARIAGAAGMSFDTIVAAGPRSWLPHGRASNAPIPAKGFVVLDFGVILDGYCSDMTRTVHVGRCSADERRVYNAVREAQQAATQAVRAGITAGEVDAAARGRLRKAGLDRYFTHSTGHGVGLEVHEPPRLGRGQAERLQTGMVVTIEPGVYIPGRGGVRIEDMVVVTESGCEVLTPVPKDLIEL